MWVAWVSPMRLNGLYLYIYIIFFSIATQLAHCRNKYTHTHTHTLNCYCMWILQIDFSTVGCSCCCYGCWYLLIIPRSTLNSINYNIFMMILFVCFFFVELNFEIRLAVGGVVYLFIGSRTNQIKKMYIMTL